LRNEYRWPGIGAVSSPPPNIFPDDADPVSAKVPFDVKVAVTLLVRFHNVDEGLRTGRHAWKMELYNE
jgi:hypothetical protein